MNFRSREHYIQRIAKLKSKGEVVNANLIRKAERNLHKMK